MSVRVRYVISFCSEHYHIVIEDLKNLELLNPNNFKQEVPIDTNSDSLHIAGQSQSINCVKIFNDNNAVSDALKVYEDIYDNECVTNVRSAVNNIMDLSEPSPNKKPFYKHPLMALALPSIVTLGTLSLVIADLKPNANIVDYLKIAALPTFLSFLSAVGIKHYGQ